MTQIPERTVVINGSGGGGGGMGMGIMLGAILVLLLGIGIVWFVVSGRASGPGTDTPISNSPTINIAPPEIKVPDTITINPPANEPANAPAQ